MGMGAQYLRLVEYVIRFVCYDTVQEAEYFVLVVSPEIIAISYYRSISQ